MEKKNMENGFVPALAWQLTRKNIRKNQKAAAKSMKMKIKKIILFPFLFLTMLAQLVYAHCPLCTAAVGAAAVGAKYFGVDTIIIGLFIGAFAISIGLWIGKLMKKQYVKFQFPIIVILSYVLTVIPVIFTVSSDSFYWPLLLFGPEGSLLNKVYWVNKMLLGSIIGSLITLIGFWLHTHIKKIKGKVLFPFQGIVLTVALLVIASIVLYFML